MKLYENSATPSCRRVNLFLAELGETFDIERIHVDARAGENLTPEFKAKSLNGMIPTLEFYNGDSLCESTAICRYFAELVGKTELFGATAFQKAKVEMWQRLLELEGITMAFQAFRHSTATFADRENCLPEWGEEASLRLQKFWPKLDAQLALGDYVIGDEFTIADISAVVLVEFATRTQGFDVNASTPHLARWWQAIQQRPSMQA